jgi:hypothetical protein
LPRPPRPERDWAALDLEEEVRSAAAIGLDGFTCDILATSGRNWDRVLALLDAAARADPGFKIVLVPDMEAEFKAHPERVSAAIRRLAAHPAAYRQADGRLVVAPFNAHRQSPAWWRAWQDDLRAHGIDVALVPILQSWRAHAAGFAPFSTGISDWGPRWPTGAAALRDVAAEAHRLGLQWMAPVSPQDMRPKSLRYWEAANTLTFRTMWESAIAGGADWVHLVSWNDYSEATEIAPSTGTQFVFYDLTAYYVHWFKTGRPPDVVRDVLYYTHRTQGSGTSRDQRRPARPFVLAGADGRRDEVELLAFLKAPGTLEVELGGETTRRTATAGITSLRVPATPGRPRFRLLRDSRQELAVESAWTIADHLPHEDLLYRGGASSRPFVRAK